MLVALSALVSANNASMQVPAVITNGGGQMILIQVEVEEGSGLVYTTTDPLVGIDTQNSERTAVDIGMAEAGVNSSLYDVMLTMDVGDTRQVDGPSAGAAMTILIISAVTGRHVRSDFTITGTIEGNGGIGPVGGVPEKVEAAALSGKRLVAVPSAGEVFDKIMIAGLRKRLNVTIVEVSDIGEAAQVAFSAEGTMPVLPPETAPVTITGLEQYNYSCETCRLEFFIRTANAVVNETAAEVGNISSQGWDNYTDAIPVLEKGVADSREMLRNNYYYAAANNGFLTSIDARVLKNAALNRRDLALSISETQGCIDSLQRPAPTRENLAYLAGGDLRATWAKRRLADVRQRELNISNSEEMLSVYRDALYATGWCTVAGELYSNAAEIGGSTVNEGVLKGYAQARVAEARMAYDAFPNIGNDADTHLRAAEAALNDTHYAAAVLDADYVLGFAALENMSGTRDAEIVAIAQNISSRKGETLWSALFFAHARFQIDANGAAGSANAIRLGSMAALMDDDLKRMDYLLQHPEEAPPAMPVAQPGMLEDVCRLNDSLLVLSLLLCILLIVSAGLNMIVFTKMKASGRARDAAMDATVEAARRKIAASKGRRRHH